MIYQKAAIYLNNAGVALLQRQHTQEAIETFAYAIQILKYLSEQPSSSCYEEHPEGSLPHVPSLMETASRRLAFCTSSREQVQQEEDEIDKTAKDYNCRNRDTFRFAVVSNTEQAQFLAKTNFFRQQQSSPGSATTKILLSIDDDSDMTSDRLSWLTGTVLYNYSMAYWSEATESCQERQQVLTACLNLLRIACASFCPEEQDMAEGSDESTDHIITLCFVLHELVKVCYTLETMTLLREYEDYQEELHCHLAAECLILKQNRFAGAA